MPENAPDLVVSRWIAIEELFVAACERPEAERAAFVAVADVDAGVRAEVMSLLDHELGAAKTLHRAVGEEVDELARARVTRHVGRRIGPYRLVGLIGEGGMGAVYAAERDDAEFAQRVAIKILPFGLDSEEAIARFRDERQILASLEHANIVRLLDGGRTDDDLPYIVMERIDGVSIVSFAAERGLTIESRVRLFRDVCTAVHYAHGKIVVHRDLKPSNILVDTVGAPKLLDFGIAKMLDPLADRQARTRTGATLFTPEYASPEQALGDAVTFASDIYSLGAVLYELLAGRPPHRGGSTLEILDRIREVDPVRPSAIALTDGHRLVGDLDNIVLKALRKAPSDRYASAEDLADDLGRYLAGLPVRARPATLRYRARKYVRRHQLLVAATAAVVAASSMTVWSLWPSRVASALPNHDRRLAIVATNRGADDDDWLALGVARLTAWRLRERDDRFTVVDDPASANVIARVEFRRTPSGALIEASIGPQQLAPIETPTLAAALDKLTPIAADLVGQDQAKRAPDERERAEMARLGARSFAAYRGYERVTFDALRTLEWANADLARRADEVIALDPSWLHPYSLLFWTVPNSDAVPEILSRAHAHGNYTSDPDGVMLLEATVLIDEPRAFELRPLEQAIANVTPIVQHDPEDLLAAWTLLSSYGLTRLRGADRISLLRRLHERYPELRFGKDLADAYRVAGRADEADATVREWLHSAPEAELAFAAAVDASTGDAAVRVARDLVFLHGESQRNLLVLCDTLIAADRTHDAAAVADRLLAGPEPDRATARSRVGIIAITEGRFGSALEALSSVTETDVANLQLAHSVAGYLGATTDRERIEARLDKLTAGDPPDSVAARARRFEAALEHGCPSIEAAMAQAPADAPIREHARRWISRAAAAKGCVPCAEVVHLGFSTSEDDPYSLLKFVDCAEHQGELELAKDGLDRIRPFREPYLSVLVHYRLGRVLEHLGKRAEARKEYEAFLAHWGHADRALPEVDDARVALTRLSR